MLSSSHASANPNAVSPIEVAPSVSMSSGHKTPVKEKPAKGGGGGNSPPSTAATAAEPSDFPTTSDAREPGATSTACRNPAWRSSITDTVAKMDANSTT